MTILGQWLDKFLNSITMYRLVLYGLGGLVVVAIILAGFGLLSFSPWSLIISLVLLLLTCYGANYMFAKLWRAPINIESADITALILFFLLMPPQSLQQGLVIAGAGVLAMASKYILAIKKKHLFNPAAMAVVIIGLFGSGLTIWWVATPFLLPLVTILGLAVVKKIRRWALFWSFMAVSLFMILFMSNGNLFMTGETIKQVLLSWPLLFFATIMLTEPATMPPTRNLQIWYGGLVGFLFFSQFHIGKLFSSPEVALVIANIFSYVVSPKQRLKLILEKSQKLTGDIYEFVFQSHEKLNFQPGQYLEWTLPAFFLDSRGNRRYFTIASSPTEENVRLGVRTFTHGSEFKKRLIALAPGSTLWASQLAGEFTLPVDKQKKLVFIAGGIGITPFRSMIKYLIDKAESRDIILLYTCLAPDHFVYQSIFAEAEKVIGLRVRYVITDEKQAPVDWSGITGFLTTDIVRFEIPDYAERIFYLSGPNVMVENYSQLLQQLQVKPQSIQKDYFPGF